MKLSLDYIAGFIDGEGCISISPSKGPRLIVTNTNKIILEEMREFFDDAGTIKIKKRRPGERGLKPCWQWVCWNRHVERVLRDLKPMLRLKAFEAELALEFLETMGRGQRRRGPLPVSVAEHRVQIARLASEVK